jgi:L-alanine-DL-glutamate epimerase-like enolase superfamily enzyme
LEVKMKIIGVETEVYQWERKVPITNGLHTYPTVTLGVVIIKTDAGIDGIGYAKSRGIKLIKNFAELLIGEDPILVEKIWHKLWVPKIVGRRGPSTDAISGIDIALWDIRAKAANMPLYKLLGGAKDRIPVYIAGGYYEAGKDLSALGKEMEDYVATGVKAIKMKVGARPISEDAKRVETVRKAVGEDIKILVDANCAYNLHEAIQFITRVEQYAPYWFEEPVSPDDYEGFRRIGEASSVPVATGENEYTKFGFRDLLLLGQVPILNADVYVVGGVTEWMKIAGMAEAHNRMIAPHGNQTIHVHLQCAIQNSLILEYYPTRFYEIGDVYTHNLELNADGTASPPDVPGHGFYPNKEVLKKYQTNKEITGWL